MKNKIKKNLLEAEKEENGEYLRKLVRISNNKKNDHDDFDFSGIRDTESLFDKVNEKDYYKLILVKRSFKSNYKYCESRGDKEKNLSVKQYLKKITPHLYDLLNDHRIARRV